MAHLVQVVRFDAEVVDHGGDVVGVAGAEVVDHAVPVGVGEHAIGVAVMVLVDEDGVDVAVAIGVLVLHVDATIQSCHQC